MQFGPESSEISRLGKRTCGPLYIPRTIRSVPSDLLNSSGNMQPFCTVGLAGGNSAGTTRQIVPWNQTLQVAGERQISNKQNVSERGRAHV